MTCSGRKLLTTFASPANIEFLYDHMLDIFTSNMIATQYINSSFRQLFETYYDNISHTMLTSEYIRDIPLSTRLSQLNRDFIADRTQLLQQLSGQNDRIPCYTVKDGSPVHTSFTPTKSSVNASLNLWQHMAARPIQCREDTMGRAPSGDGSTPSITFYDQNALTAVGNYHHYNMLFGSPYVQALNDPIMYGNQFGSGTARSDARLASRKIFRNDNQIPWYQKLLARRQYDTDITEDLRASERGCIPYGYDMEPLRQKINQRERPPIHSQVTHGRATPFSCVRY